VKQPAGRLDRDGLAGEVAADVIAVLEDADPSGPIDTTRDPLGARRRLLCRLDPQKTLGITLGW